MLFKTLTAALLVALPCQAQDAPAKPASPIAGGFKITFDSALLPGAYSGRVYIALNKDTKAEPRRQMGNWLQKNPVFSMDVKDVTPGGSVTLSKDALSYPDPLDKLEPGEYAAQAVARMNTESPHPGVSESDLYSDSVVVSLKPGDSGVVELKLTHAVPGAPFQETDRVKEFSIVSPSLSKFYGHEVKLKAGVILPKEWKDVLTARFPTVYFIGGFGADHRFATQMAGGLPKTAENCMVIIPDPSCALGHHVFADSENNGPRGKSFVEELIPAVEAKYHGAQDNPDLRVVTGVSSGGWSSLWLVLNYPEKFAGCWSYCPDPVDFRDFQRINLYKDHVNMYKDENSERRPLARDSKEKVIIWYDDFCKQERVIGDGGQIHSFEAVFSPKGADGNPKPLFDRDSGEVNHDVALAWDKYDIRLFIERNWSTLGPRVKGKMHIYGGELDNFYLDGAVRLLADSLSKLDSDPDVHIIKKMGHNIYRPSFDVLFRVLNEKVNPTPPDQIIGNPNEPKH